MKLIVFGAAGGTGKQVIEQALAAGHQVTGVVRHPAAFPFQHPQLSVRPGDVLQPVDFKDFLAGADAVISCLGSRGGKPTTVYSEGIRNIAQAMRQVGVTRLLCLSSVGVVIPPRSSLLVKLITKYILWTLFPHLYEDMRQMEAWLRESDLNWTVVRPPRLINAKSTGHYRTTINEPIRNPSSISRADLAHYVLNHLSDEKTERAWVEISY